MTQNQKIGAFGEQLTAQFLLKRGYQIVGRNLKTSYKELDLVAIRDNFIIFVEVKTRTNLKYGSAEEMMSVRKLNNLKFAAYHYLAANKLSFRNLRFDFVAVDISVFKKTAKIKHFKDII